MTDCSANMQKFTDIVATNGAYLVPRPATPVFERTPNEEFAATLYQELHALLVVQNCRRNMYRQAAEEWPIGRTPPEVKEQRDAELKELLQFEGITSDSSGDSDKSEDAAGGDAGLEEDVVATADRPHPPPQARFQPIPALSVDVPPSTLRGRKRRRISGSDKENNGEKQRPRKNLFSSTTTDHVENARNGSQGMSRKRRRTCGDDDDDDDDDDEAGILQRPTKTHVSATRTSRRLQACRPIQSRVGGNDEVMNFAVRRQCQRLGPLRSKDVTLSSRRSTRTTTA
ncbi:MAG: hypothetical protein Q9198_006917 [Flavoplaca austrocitrina]